jgi:hypothetical protein
LRRINKGRRSLEEEYSFLPLALMAFDGGNKVPWSG